MAAIDRAAALLGGQARLAEALGVHRMTISQWKRRQVPASRVLSVEAATGYRVSRHELRPDLYPREPWCRCPACRRAGEEPGAGEEAA